jgi:hypothetical protein
LADFEAELGILIIGSKKEKAASSRRLFLFLKEKGGMPFGVSGMEGTWIERTRRRGHST